FFNPSRCLRPNAPCPTTTIFMVCSLLSVAARFKEWLALPAVRPAYRIPIREARRSTERLPYGERIVTPTDCQARPAGGNPRQGIDRSKIDSTSCLRGPCNRPHRRGGG